METKYEQQRKNFAHTFRQVLQILGTHKMPMKVPHHLSLANVAELSNTLSVRRLEIITSIMKKINYRKKRFANGFFKNPGIYSHNLLFLNLFQKHLRISILKLFGLMLKGIALRPRSIWKKFYLSGCNV